jgi:hypothetical protein
MPTKLDRESLVGPLGSGTGQWNHLRTSAAVIVDFQIG